MQRLILKSGRGDSFGAEFFYWLIPTKERPYVELKPRQALQYDFVQCLDGRFSYDIWIYAAFEKIRTSVFLWTGRSFMKRCECRWLQRRVEPLGSFQALRGIGFYSPALTRLQAGWYFDYARTGLYPDGRTADLLMTGDSGRKRCMHFGKKRSAGNKTRIRGRKRSGKRS